jgi:hypothetical protein
MIHVYVSDSQRPELEQVRKATYHTIPKGGVRESQRHNHR